MEGQEEQDKGKEEENGPSSSSGEEQAQNDRTNGGAKRKKTKTANSGSSRKKNVINLTTAGNKVMNSSALERHICAILNRRNKNSKRGHKQTELHNPTESIKWCPVTDQESKDTTLAFIHICVISFAWKTLLWDLTKQ